MDPAQATASLVQQGTLGLLAFLLLVALKVVWSKYTGVQQKLEDIQQKRVEERDVLVRQLMESTKALSDVAERLRRR